MWLVLVNFRFVMVLLRLGEFFSTLMFDHERNGKHFREKAHYIWILDS